MQPPITITSFDPFTPDEYSEAAQERGFMAAPLLICWTYDVPCGRAFRDWLSLREIMLSPDRLIADPLLSGVRYRGTYLAPPDGEPTATANTVAQAGTGQGEAAQAAQCTTHWGFTSHASIQAMHDLCSGKVAYKSIVQVDFCSFVDGLKSHHEGASATGFRQNVWIGAAAGIHSTVELAGAAE